MTKDARSVRICESPLDLLSSLRFDVAAKLYFLRIWNVNPKCTRFHYRLYVEHLRVWNGLHEVEPKKSSARAFLDSFIDTFLSIKSRGYNLEFSPVPIRNNSIFNGAHRLASCVYLNKPILVSEQFGAGQLSCTYDYLRNKRDFVSTGLSELFLNEMMLEFLSYKSKKSLHCVFFFAADKYDDSYLKQSLVGSCSEIFFERRIACTSSQLIKIFYSLYYGESWLGSPDNGYQGLRRKVEACMEESTTFSFLIVELRSNSSMSHLKLRLREHYGRGNHSLHTTDNHEDAFSAYSMLLSRNNPGSFLRFHTFSLTPQFTLLLGRFKNWICFHNLDSRDFCVVSGAVLALFGVRDCVDFDVICLSDSFPEFPEGIHAHESELLFYNSSKDEIILNPDLHFYYLGIKFSTLDVVAGLKRNRFEPKDRLDLDLLSSVWSRFS